MRINKYISQAGIASRRKADQLIEAGQVKVNGAVLKEPGYDVQDGDMIVVSGRLITEKQPLVYYALNKPEGYVTTTSDDKDRPIVTDLLTDVTARVFPIGRLDYDSCGLLLLTSDGEMAQKIAHPSKKVVKTYLAEINGAISIAEVERLKEGVFIDGRKTAPAEITVLKQAAHASLLEVKIHEGRNRQVRKMFKTLGYTVTGLQRTAIGNIRLGHLREGGYRKLSRDELDYLKKL